MIDEKIIKLRKKLDYSIEKEIDYTIIYSLSVELDEAISNYYRRKLIKTTSVKKVNTVC